MRNRACLIAAILTLTAGAAGQTQNAPEASGTPAPSSTRQVAPVNPLRTSAPAKAAPAPKPVAQTAPKPAAAAAPKPASAPAPKTATCPTPAASTQRPKASAAAAPQTPATGSTWRPRHFRSSWRRPVASAWRRTAPISSTRRVPAARQAVTPPVARATVAAPVAKSVAAAALKAKATPVPVAHKAAKPRPAQAAATRPSAPKPPELFGSGFAALGAAGVLVGKLLFVLVLAYLSVVALKVFWSRSARPLKFGVRTLLVEESAPLGVGAAIHLVRVAGRRLLVGTAQGQINILADLDEQAAPSVAGASEQPVAQPGVEPGLKQVVLSGLLEKLTRRPAAGEEEAPAVGVAGELRKSTQFIEEIRARMDTTPHGR